MKGEPGSGNLLQRSGSLNLPCPLSSQYSNLCPPTQSWIYLWMGSDQRSPPYCPDPPEPPNGFPGRYKMVDCWTDVGLLDFWTFTSWCLRILDCTHSNFNLKVQTSKEISMQGWFCLHNFIVWAVGVYIQMISRRSISQWHSPTKRRPCCPIRAWGEYWASAPIPY